MSKIKVKIPKRIGKISPKNKLNDLTGSEWLYFLCSVFTTSYSTKGAESFSHHIRKHHPSPKPPQLMEGIIKFFTKRNQWVLDPFMGVGGTFKFSFTQTFLYRLSVFGFKFQFHTLNLYRK